MTFELKIAENCLVEQNKNKYDVFQYIAALPAL